MYTTVWTMEDLDLECAKTDINCGTDLMFYIEMDPPGNTAVLMEKLVNFLTLIFFWKAAVNRSSRGCYFY